MKDKIIQLQTKQRIVENMLRQELGSSQMDLVNELIEINIELESLSNK